jgi:hypothetical protein
MIDFMKWYCDIADLRLKYQDVRALSDFAGKTKQQKFKIQGILCHFGESYEQWQNVSALSSIRSIMLFARTVRAESGAASRFWFRAAAHCKDARNAMHMSESVHLYIQSYIENQETSADLEHCDAGPSYT